MNPRRQPSPIDMQACREAWRLQELGCDGSPQVQAVMLYAVAKAINRPIETMPRPELDQLWEAFKAVVHREAVKLPDLPLPLLSHGERFALAVGVLFDADHLPTGETFAETLNSAIGCGVDRLPSTSALRATLLSDTVRSAVSGVSWQFHMGTPRRHYEPVDVGALATILLQDQDT